MPRSPGVPIEVWIVVGGLFVVFVVGTVLVRGWGTLAAWAFLALFALFIGVRVAGTSRWPRRRSRP